MKAHFIIFIILFFIINTYPIIRFWRLSGSGLQSKPFRVTIMAILIVLALCFPFSFLAQFKDIASQTTIGILQTLGGIWLGFLLYSIIGFTITDILYWCKVLRSRRLRLYIPIIGTIILLIYGNIKYHHPSIERYTIELNDNGERLQQSTPFRIVVASDIHLGHSTGKAQLNKYVELINGENPDLILLAGDIIDNDIRPIVNDKMDEELSRLNSTYGTYAVVGNHEYISGIDESLNFLNKTDIIILRDSVVTIADKIQIIGRDDRSNHKRKPLESLIAQTHDTIPTLLLDHQPYNLKQADSLEIDIQCYGHTHNGQMWPLNLLIKNMYEQGSGYRKWGNSHIFVSSGLSLWGPKFRIGTQSEIIVIDLI